MKHGKHIVQWRTVRRRLLARARQRILELGLNDDFEDILVAAAGNDDILKMLLDSLGICIESQNEIGDES